MIIAHLSPATLLPGRNAGVSFMETCFLLVLSRRSYAVSYAVCVGYSVSTAGCIDADCRMCRRISVQKSLESQAKEHGSCSFRKRLDLAAEQVRAERINEEQARERTRRGRCSSVNDALVRMMGEMTRTQQGQMDMLRRTASRGGTVRMRNAWNACGRRWIRRLSSI